MSVQKECKNKLKRKGLREKNGSMVGKMTNFLYFCDTFFKLNYKMIDKFLKQATFASYEDFMQNFSVNIPERFNFGYDIVDRYAEEQPDKLAILWTDGKRRVPVTYGDYKEESDRVASMFLSLGIRKGDCVMLILRRRLEWWMCMIALHKIGAIAIPASQLLTAKDIVYRCQAADIKAIVALGEEPITSHINNALPECNSLEHLISVGPSVPQGWVNYRKAVDEAPAFVRPEWEITNEDNMLLYFTSGTAGQPKMVVHSFDYPMCHFLTAVWQNLDATCTALTMSDTSWAMAIWGSFYPQMLAGAAICVYDVQGKFDAKNLLALLEREKVTTFFAAPTVYRFMMHEDMESYDLSSLRWCNIAGEAMYPSFYEEWKRRTGIVLRECYGQTESALIIGTMPWCEPHPGSMGVDNPQYSLQILDKDGNECPVGVPGNMVIRCDGERHPIGLLRGYYRSPELTAKAFRDGKYYTGDVVYRDADGYYWFESRADDVIKSSGYRIGPFEVESALMTHPAVAECAITGVPDEIRGQIVKATVVLAADYKEHANDVLKKELQNHVKNVTAPYKYPRVIEFVDELPKTINGKLRRVEIREKDAKDAKDAMEAKK